VRVSAPFLEVLVTSIEAARATSGVFDPTLLHQMVELGYDRTFSDLPAIRAGSPALEAPRGAWREIVIDRDRRQITLPSHTGLDFGGIVKGMAVDAVVERLMAAGVDRAVVEAGGDLRVCGAPDDGMSTWPVAVERRGEPQIVGLHSAAMATTSLSRRRWRLGDQTVHHLLDPRTGRPTANGVWSVSVVARLCVHGEVAAKTALILGFDEGSRFLSLHGFSALMVAEDGAERRTGEWPARRSVADT
jgi:thiamine biosynthesis lipoprotein